MGEINPINPLWKTEITKTKCNCRQGLLTKHRSYTGGNYKRDFVKCPLEISKGGCGFWCWEDELCICRCEKGFCNVKTSKKDCSKGNRFYCCPESKNVGVKGCGFFAWLEESSHTYDKKVDECASSSQQNETVKEKLMMELEVERRAMLRQSEFCESLMKKFANIKFQ